MLDAPSLPPDAEVIDVLSVETNCNDLLDDDGDGDTDCADSDCAADPECIPETVCDDGIDNEGDGEADCLDQDCDAVAGCEFGSEATCNDSQDNDGDTLTDCEDMDCDGVGFCRFGGEVTCDDGVDNDSDGTADCLDADCNGVAGCEFGSEVTCDDAIDNDGDGPADCLDDSCNGIASCEFGAELTCGDAFDNDSDGTTDCLDTDCDTVSGCEFGAELTCGDGIDNDGDGSTDCPDSDCTSTGTCLTGCPATGTVTTLVATDVPLAIQDNTAPVTISNVTMPTTGVVLSAAVGIDLTHTYDGDINITLTSATGSVLNLSMTNGGSGDNYTGTLLTDLGPGVIGSVGFNTAPFTGLYQPEQPFSTLAGQAAAGTWALTIDDVASGDIGTLTNYTLHLCSCNGTAGCEFGAACRDGVSNDDDALADCADTDCAADPFCIPEANCSDVVDNDFDGLTDCDDGNCNGIAGCEFGIELTCTDGFDNDSDATVDCNDSDCTAGAWCSAEVDCANTLDDDSDGFADCLDIGCNGVGSCQFGTETSCADAFDNDGDGMTDCADTNCSSFLACQVPACPAGTSPILVSDTDVPVSFPDNATGTATIAVTDVGISSRVVMQLSINHTWVADMNISMISPTGVTRNVSSGNGGSGDNYTNTVFIDSAAGVIGTAGFNTAPFNGQYRPEEPFTVFDGEPLTGDWVLQIADTFPGFSNPVVTQYNILFCACNGTAGCEFGAACADGISNDDDALVDCLDPDCATNPRCIPEPNCTNGVDDDLDGQVDCLDLDCNGISGCEFGVELTCNDALDNDADGAFNCADTDCATNPICSTPETDCDNGLDDDFDTLIDCADPTCAGVDGCEDDATNNTPADSLTSPQGIITTSGVMRRGSISVIGDRDYWAVTVTAATDVRAEVFQQGTFCPSGYDPDVRLYAIDGTTELAYSDGDAWTAGSPGAGWCPHIGQVLDTGVRRLAPGTYYIAVSGYADGTVVNNYELHVNFEAVCGDGLLTGSEACDDSNLVAGDGCNLDCTDELAGAVCGNAIIETGEECDGGATCDAACARIAACGDGWVDSPETCDDGGIVDGDGCSAACASELVINEIDYDQTSTDTAEYLEIYNRSATTVNLTGIRLYPIDGGTTTTPVNRTYGSNTFELSTAAATLAPGQYLVVARSTVVLPPGTPVISVGTNDFLQNGASPGSDGVVLVNRTSRTVIDALSYEGSGITLARIPTFARNASLVEGTAFTTADIDSNGYLARTPNGTDNNTASTDWVLGNVAAGGALTPGAANP